jgi:hypothetical protein
LFELIYLNPKKDTMIFGLNRFYKKTPVNISFLISLIVPVLFVGTGFYVLRLFGPLSLRHGDPDFIYLLSGLSMADGHLNVGHVDNPGTPLQIIVAIVTRIVHLFAGKGSYFDDILKRPDFYLNQVLHFNYLLNAAFMFFVGFKTGKYLRLSYIPLIQLTLLMSWVVFYNTTTVIPEVIMLVPVSMFTIFFLRLYKNKELISDYKDVLKVAAISALGVSIKLDYLPLVFLPVFLIRSWKRQIVYWPSFFVLFLIFAFPVLKRRFFFIEWIKGLITHSGKYGLGDSDFIDWPAFIENIKTLFSFYKFFYTALLILVFLFILSITGLKWFNKNQIRESIIGGIILTTILQTFIVAKHFGLLYMMPLIYLLPLILILIIEMPKLNKYITYAIPIVVTVIILFFFYKTLNRNLSWKVPQLATKLEIKTKINNMVNDAPFIIIDQSYNFYFHESPLLFGWFFQGSTRYKIKDRLDEIYPQTYVYDNGKKKFFLWGDLYKLKEIFEKQDEIFVFLNSKSQHFYDLQFNPDSLSFKADTLYKHSLTKDKLLKIEISDSIPSMVQ